MLGTEIIVEETAAEVRALKGRIAALEARVAQAPRADLLNILVFSGDRDRLLAALTIATGAAACGTDVNMFFTFWGTSALKSGGRQIGRKSLVERAFGWMLPNGLRQTKLSQMDMGGIGRLLMTREMKAKNIADADQLLKTAAELGVKIRVCEMSMHLMGIRREELVEYPNLEYCGAASFVELTSQANTTLFI